ncbi:MAG TPA: DUF3084 domain-containing protein [Cyanobacteria bacterium UBA8543]|nr:DUF3084 domain-containing protein [Cyanobacteria bacterium UBA8543]
MTSGYILIVAILVLGGVIATLGDRIGTKVGKARLSLFNLRPRNTATLVTIITGSLISASTLGILFATSGSLRDGIFELDSILRKLRDARSDIERINAQKSKVESELTKARGEQAEAQNRLDVTNRNFQQATTQLKKISQQATVLRTEVNLLLGEREKLLKQRQQLGEQITQLKTQVDQLKDFVAQRDQELAKRAETIKQRNRELAQQDEAIAKLDQKTAARDRIINQRDRIINQRDQLIAERDQVIAQRETRLQELQQQLKEAIAQREIRLNALEQELTKQESQIIARDKQIKEGEKQLAYLEQEVETLEQYFQNYQALRQGNVALVRGQILASGVVRIVEPSAATEAVEQLLREANRTAIKITRSANSTSNEALVQIPKLQVEQLINQIKDGKDYVVRILSAGNYVEGEKQVQVFADAALNQVIFQAGDVLATLTTDTSTMTNLEVRQKLDQLLAAAQFRARRAGILGVVQIGDGRITTVMSFIEQLERYNQSVDIRAVAQETTYTAGPLRMQLIATQNGQVIFKT